VVCWVCLRLPDIFVMNQPPRCKGHEMA